MRYVCMRNNCIIFCQKCQRVKHIVMGNNANKAVIDPTKVTKPAKDANEAIGRKGYVIIAQLGEGGFGKVYKVKAKDSNEMFAIKETPFLGEEEYDRTMREVANGCILNHMNIVKLYEYFIDKGTNNLYLTMELCEFNLRQWFARTVKNRSYSEGIRLIRQIAAGVEYFHGKNIIHRDLKPENILIINNTCKIADFGLSKINIKSQSLVGTPIYASPEQIFFGDYDLKTDIYPMGLMVMEFFTVFNNCDDWLKAMKNIQNRNPEFPEKFFERHKDNSPQMYTEAKNLVLLMTKQNPNERPTIKEVIKHPFFGTQTDAPQRESNQVNNRNDGDDIKRLIAALMLLRRLRNDNDDEKDEENDGNGETYETDNGSKNQILSKALSQRASEHEKSSNESEEISRILNDVTSQGEEQSHRGRINDSNERNRILSDIITQGHARRQQIFDEIEERNRMILDIMAQGDAQVKQLWDEMREEMKIIIAIIIDGKSHDEISDDIKQKLKDILMIILKGTKSLKKLQEFEGLNRTITEALTEHQMHRSIYDNIDDKMRTLITDISVDTDDSKDKAESKDEDLEDNILAACESYTDNIQLERSLMALYHCLKTRAKKFQNIKRALDIVIHTMTEKPQETEILTVALAALSHIVKSDELKLNPNTDIGRKIITKILDAMHAHRDETGIFVNGFKTLISFEIPDDVIFEYSRIVNILLYNIGKGYADSLIQKECIQILSLLTNVKDKRNIIGDLGGIQKIIEFINSRLQRKLCDEVMIEAWNVMWNIMDENPINCERFLYNNGLQCFISCTHTFPKNVELIHSMMGVMSNFAECDHLRHRLMESEYIKILIKHLDCSERDNFEVSYAAAGILSHIASDGPQSWHQYLPFERSDILRRLNASISQWKINYKRNVNYNSFKPFLRLLRSDQSPPEAKYWAIWALANLTRVNCSRYCPMLEDDNTRETLKCVIRNSETQTHIRQLAIVTLVHYNKYKKDGDLGSMEDSDVILF